MSAWPSRWNDNATGCGQEPGSRVGTLVVSLSALGTPHAAAQHGGHVTQWPWSGPPGDGSRTADDVETWGFDVRS